MSGWCAFEACRVGYDLTASFTEALRVFTCLWAIVVQLLMHVFHQPLTVNCHSHIFLQADSVTMRITNQKNGCMGQTIHHKAVSLPHCPVKALA